MVSGNLYHYREVRLNWFLLSIAGMSVAVALYADCQRSGREVGPLSSFRETDLGFSAAKIGLLPAFVSPRLCVTSIPAGWLMDNFGVRWTASCGAFICGIGLISLFSVS